MINIVHDFYSNFNNALLSKDDKLTLDMLISELSTLIVKNKQRVIEMMNAAGVKTNKGISDTALANKIIDNAENNNKVRHGISFLIAEKHDLMNYSNTVTDDLKEGLKTGTSAGAPADPVSAIAAGVGSIFGFLKSNKDGKNAKADAKNQLTMQILAQRGSKKMSTGSIIAIVGGVVAVLGITLYFVTKKS